ncbi:ABC transporter ATP-binding protein [Enterovirga sp.]|uniref:ABC transporter ATP-binding protein n=1 Tax=Enterovirga sp. TaxID=2026350 RepID=UPI002C62A2B6|nr:ABC transporter ATP-binding protein [Enterovirga sp.]HMO28865.1 ABC transporter ATP-binding protein [Enterovirga sp.]
MVTSKTIIRIANVTRRFGTAVAIDGVSLDLEEGEFFCLLGPSGCGKSTLLRLLAGFETASQGRIELDGEDLTRTPPHQRPINMMFQSYALFPHMTVAGNIAYGLKLAGLPREECAARLADMVRLGRLEGLEGRYPAQLSGGQRQRVALARALARRPRVLLLDEPLGALDRALREETQAELKALQAQVGTTFVMVTHDQDEAMGLADRIGVMQAGRLVQVGTPREIYEEPASRFVAGFVGAANLLEGVLESRLGGFARIVLAGGETVEAAAQAGEPGDAVAVMVRPERLALAARDIEGPNRLDGIVTGASYLGGQVALRIALREGQEVRVSAPAGFAGEVPAPGEPARIAFAAAAARVLP